MAGGVDDMHFIRPSSGSLLAGFDERATRVSILLARRVIRYWPRPMAAWCMPAPACVAMGNLVILKHNNTFLTAYAHNQTLLVKEDQNVRGARRSPRWAAPMPTG